MADDPIFIGGMFKSGTSLLRAMLGRHSRLFAGLETQWLHQSWTDQAQARRWLERLSVFYEVPHGELERMCGDAPNVETALDRLMRELSARADKLRWIEKTPENVGAIDRILGYWPAARILHIIRDPRDVYASHVEAGKWVAPEEFAPRWCETIGVARYWLSAQGGAHTGYLEICYERLVLAPVEETRRALEFLGEDWEPQVADFVGRPEDFERVLAATGRQSASLKRLAQPLTAKRVGLWQDLISPRDWAPIRSEIERCGYGALLAELTAEADARAADRYTRSRATAL